MPNYRRAFLPGGTFFFTLVTETRQPIFADERARFYLHEAIADGIQRRPFDLLAIVLLPDHLHTVWTLPHGDTDFSSRWSMIKSHFTRNWLANCGRETPVSSSRRQNRRRGVWQRRFYEHTIRGTDDLNNHLDYIHYNPVKHGLATCPHGWPHSSFERWVRNGAYPHDWCCICNSRPPDKINFDWVKGLE